MKMFKKGISVLTALVMVFAMFAGTAYAADYSFATELVDENFKDFAFTDGKCTLDGVYYANNGTDDKGTIEKSSVGFDTTSEIDCLKYTAKKTWNDYYVSISRQGSGNKPEWKSGNGSQILSFRFAYVQSGDNELGRINLNGNMYYIANDDNEKTATYRWDNDSQGRFLSFKRTSVEAFGNEFKQADIGKDNWFNIEPNIWYTVTLILNGDNTYTLKIYNNSLKKEMILENKTMKYMSVKDYNNGNKFYEKVKFRGISILNIAHQGSNVGDSLYIDDVQLYKSEAKNYFINNVKAASTVVTTFADAKGKTITAVNIDKYNYSADNTVIAALYDSEGNMKKVCTAKYKLGQFSNEDVQLTGGLEIPDDADGYVKVMIFDNMTSLYPLCTAYTLE